jgi:hypothetical protein
LSPPGVVAHEGLHTLLHLVGRLVGKGEGQDVARLGFAGGQQIGDAVGQRARLAGPRPGDNHDRPLGGRHGLALLVVEAVENALLGLRVGVNLGMGRGTADRDAAHAAGQGSV